METSSCSSETAPLSRRRRRSASFEPSELTTPPRGHSRLPFVAAIGRLLHWEQQADTVIEHESRRRTSAAEALSAARADKALVDFDCDCPRVITDSEEISNWERDESQASTSSLAQRAIASGWDNNTLPCWQRICALQPWFHANMRRQAAESLMSSTADGTFLVRTNEHKRRMVLSVMYKGTVYHYAVWLKREDRRTYLSIDARTQFADLLSLISFYTMNQGNLPCKLNKPAPTPALEVPSYENPLMASSL